MGQWDVLRHSRGEGIARVDHADSRRYRVFSPAGGSADQLSILAPELPELPNVPGTPQRTDRRPCMNGHTLRAGCDGRRRVTPFIDRRVVSEH